MLKIKYTNGQGIATGGTATNAESISSSVVDTFNTIESCDYLSVDGLGIDLSGTKSFFSTNDYAGVISTAMSSGNSAPYLVSGFSVTYNGDFASLKDKGLYIKFAKNKVHHFSVTRHSQSGGYATHRIYSGSASGVNVKANCGYPLVNGNHPSYANEFFIPAEAFDDYAYDSLEISDIYTQNRNAKAYIENVALSEVTKGEITSVKSHNLLEEINILSTDLPINQFEAVIATNERPAVDTKIKVMSNEDNFGTFYVTEVEQIAKKLEVNDNIYGEDLFSIVAVNTIGLLDRGTFRKWRSAAYFDTDKQEWTGWSGVRLTEFLDDMQSNTGVRATSNESRYDVDTFGLLGYIDKQTYRHNLCAVGFALDFMVDGSRSDKVYFREIPTGTDESPLSPVRRYTTDRENIIGEAVYTRSPKITKVEIYRYPETKISQIGDIVIDSSANPYSKDNTYWFAMPSGNNQRIDYDLSSVTINKFNGGTLTGTFNAYADKTDFSTTMKTEWIRLPLEVVPIITERTVQSASEENILNVDYFSVQGVRNISTMPSSTIYFSYYENAFSGTNMTRVGHILSFARSKGKVNAKIIMTKDLTGKYEKVGDPVLIETEFGEIVKGIITKMSIEFGYDNIANIEVTEWDTVWSD